ncbi:MAG: DUF4340 domain-containing protein [Spirochaetes bacterium]|jgi:hypothetical protein|nr:DUF4340 domain-containing protein [Spirochaetota bacterium]
MNKGKLYSLITIVVLIFLIFAKDFFSGVSLPELPEWKGDPDLITIDRGDDTVRLVKKGESWFINDTNFEASENEVATIISKLRTLKFFDKISSGDSLARYELEDEKALRVTVKSSDTVLIDLLVGKESSGMNQSYVRMVDDSTVYLAGTITPRDLRKSILELRSKEVIKLSYRSIESFTVQFEDSSYTLLPVDKDVEVEDGTTQSRRFWTFKNTPSIEVDMNSAVSMFNAVNPFVADRISASGLEEGLEPLGMMEAVVDGKAITVTCVNKDDRNNYYLTVSGSDDVYVVNESRIRNVFRKKSDLIADEK